MEVFLNQSRPIPGLLRLLHVRGGVSNATPMRGGIRRLLHVRGGVSLWPCGPRALRKSSPRPWRCFRQKAGVSGVFAVFSTSVEVFPKTKEPAAAVPCLLHVRGGVSPTHFCYLNPFWSSPRPWRCFLDGSALAAALIVFSTSVEVFLEVRYIHQHGFRLLHVRGGVSSTSFFSIMQAWSSPRPWRCFHV